MRHAGVNDSSVGRDVGEYLRLLDAFEHVEKHGEVCPAGWKKSGDAAMKPDHGEEITKIY